MNEKELTVILSNLKKNGSDINLEASGIVTKDGLSMASELPDGLNEDLVCPMCAGVFSFGKGVAQGLDFGELEQIIVKGSKGSALVYSVGEQLMLTFKIKSNGDLMKASELARDAADEVRSVMSIR